MGAAARLHDDRSAAFTENPKGSGRAIFRTGQVSRVSAFRTAQQKRADGEALAKAIDLARSTVAEVARAWARDESLVRAVCEGRKPLSEGKVAKLPARVRQVLVRGVQLDLFRSQP